MFMCKKYAIVSVRIFKAARHVDTLSSKVNERNLMVSGREIMTDQWRANVVVL